MTKGFLIIIISILTVVNILSCGHKEISKTSMNPLSEIVESSVKADTLLIISTDEYLYYPFGKINKPLQFLQDCRFKISEEKDKNIYSYRLDSSFLQLYLSEDSNLLEVVKANINDEQIFLDNFINIGTSKKDFFAYFGLNFENAINVVEMQSGLLGIWHYYNFENNQLKSIVLESDYSF